jgi:GYF domain 2
VQYFVKRGDQRFGPYSLSDLQRYVQSGNIATEDLTQSEGMTDWVPVSQVLGNIPATAVTAGGAAAAPAPERELVPLPPNWHWSIILVLGLITRQLFNLIWALIQANWARKLSGDNKPMVLVAMYPAGMVAGTLIVILFRGQALAGLGGLFILGGAIVYIVGVFSIRSAMEDYYNSTEPIGLQLSGVMTFFFSTVYIQYHINKIARWKKTGVLT